MSLFSRTPYKPGDESAESEKSSAINQTPENSTHEAVTGGSHLSFDYDDSLDKALDDELAQITQNTQSNRPWSTQAKTPYSKESPVPSQQHSQNEPAAETKLSFRKPRTLEQQLDIDTLQSRSTLAASNSPVRNNPIVTAAVELAKHADIAHSEQVKTTLPSAASKTIGSTPAARPPAPKPQYTEYGINQTIALLNRLPETGDPSILMTIVKRTLEATGVNIQDIIKDSQRKKYDVKNSIKQLEAQVRDLERQLKARNGEIASLTADLEETERVQEMLELAEVPPAKGYDKAEQTSTANQSA